MMGGRILWFIVGAIAVLWIMAPGAEAQISNDELMDGLIEINSKLNDQDTVLQTLTADIAAIEAKVVTLESNTNSSMAGLQKGVTGLDVQVQTLKQDLVQVRTQLVAIEDDTSQVEQVQATTQSTNEQVSKSNNLGWFIAIQVAVLMGFVLRANPEVLRFKRKGPTDDGRDIPPEKPVKQKTVNGATPDASSTEPTKKAALKDRVSQAFTKAKAEKKDPMPDDLEEQLQANKEAREKVAHNINGAAPIQKHTEERDARMMTDIDRMLATNGSAHGI